MAMTANIVFDQGSSSSAIIEVVNDDGTPYDLTDLDVKSQFRKSPFSDTAHDFDVTVLDALNGLIKLEFSRSASNAIDIMITFPRFVYDVLVFKDSTDFGKRVVQGLFTLSPTVTR